MKMITKQRWGFCDRLTHWQHRATAGKRLNDLLSKSQTGKRENGRLRQFSNINQELLFPRSILSGPHAAAAQHHISKTVNSPAVHVVSRISLKNKILVKGKVRQERSNEQMRRKRKRRNAPEKVDLSSKCSSCCHSCIWFSRTQVTSRGVIWTSKENSAEGKGLCLNKNSTDDPPPNIYHKCWYWYKNHTSPLSTWQPDNDNTPESPRDPKIVQHVIRQIAIFTL